MPECYESRHRDVADGLDLKGEMGVKLLRVGPPSAETPAGIGADGIPRSFADVVSDWTPEFLTDPRLRDLAAAGAPIVGGTRIGAPLARIGKVVCVGLNYRKHAQEANLPVPDEPVLFLKTPDVIVGPDDPVRVPPGSQKTDYEVELGVVIGRTTRRLHSPSRALEHVLGYVLANDVSERSFQLERGGSWDKGKNCDDFLPLGPWIATADEIDDPQNIILESRVNGQLRQSASTADMIFPVDHLIWYISRFLTLHPGDLVLTGTPHGVGSGFLPPRFLSPGDVVELHGTGLGAQRTVFVDGAAHDD